MENSIPKERSRPTPAGGSNEHSPKEEGNGMFGFTVFLLSESVIFLSFFMAYIALRATSHHWLPPDISPLELSKPAINTAVLVSSSFVIYFAERALDRQNLNQFRLLWLTTSAMGIYFLVGQAIEWSGLSFKLTTGALGGTFYVLTGFHGLHVFAGVVLQMLMLLRSFLPGNYNSGHFGVSATSLFWHFVDVIWVILFSLIYLWRP